MPRVLPSLISFLQYGDASESPAYEILDQRVHDLFPTETARRIADELERRDRLMFFSKRQLLLAIKLTCVFGSRDNGEESVNYSQFLKLLLMVNGFYQGGDDAPNTPEGDMVAVQETASILLVQHLLVQHLLAPFVYDLQAGLYAFLGAMSDDD